MIKRNQEWNWIRDDWKLIEEANGKSLEFVVENVRDGTHYILIVWFERMGGPNSKSSGHNLIDVIISQINQYIDFKAINKGDYYSKLGSVTLFFNVRDTNCILEFVSPIFLYLLKRPDNISIIKSEWEWSTTQIHWITCCDRQSFELNRISFSIRVKVVCFFLTSTRFSFSVFLSVFIRFIRVCVCFQHYAMHPCSCTTGTSVVVVFFFFWKTKAFI